MKLHSNLIDMPYMDIIGLGMIHIETLWYIASSPEPDYKWTYVTPINGLTNGQYIGL